MIDEVFEVSEDGSILLRLHVQPGAGRTAATGRYGDALKVRVAAPPEGGRANEACVKLVAATLGVPEGQVALVSGPSSRSKRVRITGVEADDARRLLSAAIEASADRSGGNARPGGGVR